jgi:2-amino-4-hydroxy-6-hydroxymethyldihydropteridine diphosphokinase
MARVYLGLGSNIDPAHYVRCCLDDLKARFGALAISTIYRCEAVGFEGDDFYNLVVGLQTDLPLDELFRTLRSMEYAHHRGDDAKKFSSRTLDIDILIYDDYVGAFEGGLLPRRDIRQHAFVLRPLAELDGERLHPELGVSFARLWSDYDHRSQRLIPVDFKWQGRQISRSSV